MDPTIRQSARFRHNYAEDELDPCDPVVNENAESNPHLAEDEDSEED